ncbi:MAG: hypothetical protein M1275_01405 [Patescibacteria group bacterium]|nr:hypothetical protein [Patescibacteria group bacterium]
MLKNIMRVLGVIVGLFVIINATTHLFLGYPLIDLRNLGQSGAKSARLQIYKTVAPKPIAELAVTKNISASKGGELKLTDDKGVETTLFVFPGSLASDTTITMSPLQEVPIQGYVSTLGNGVLIEPETLKFKDPAILTFEFSPGEKNSPKPFGVLPGFTGTDQKVAAAARITEGEVLGLRIVKYAKLKTLKYLKSFPEWMMQPGVIISANSKTGQTGIAPSGRTESGSAISGSVSSGGSYSPDEPDAKKAEDFGKQSSDGTADTSNKNGTDDNSPDNGEGGDKSGKDDSTANKCSADTAQCDFDTIKELLELMQMQQALGGEEDVWGTTATGIKSCVSRMVDDIKCKCDSGKQIEVRRADFIEILQFTERFDEALTQKTLQTMKQCATEYKVKAEASAMMNGGKVTDKFNAKVCGFVDDQWQGKQYSSIEVDVAQQYFDPAIKFYLPGRGGEFEGLTKGTVKAKVLIGMTENHEPIFGEQDFGSADTGVAGQFDGKDTVMFQGTTGDSVEGKITTDNKTCDDVFGEQFQY